MLDLLRVDKKTTNIKNLANDCLKEMNSNSDGKVSKGWCRFFISLLFKNL